MGKDHMQEAFVARARQPQVAVATLSLALAAVVASYSWNMRGLASTVGAGTLPLAVIFVLSCLLAYQFPIYIRHNTKICILSIPLYLMAALLPPPVAATAAALAMTSGELLVRRRRGTYPSDIATTAGRWILISLAGSIVAHIPLTVSNPILAQAPLVACAVVLWAGDLLTLPLSLVSVTPEKPGRIIATVAREGGLAELAQYLLGFVGAVAATHQVWALGMLAVPTLLVYLTFKKELDPDTFELLQSMADTVDLRDPYTAGHSRRVARLAAGVLNELGMHGQEAQLITSAARIHDLGKTGLPDGVLIKAGALSTAEEALVQSHAEQGVALLSRYPDFSRGVEMVRHHHERWDGAGYPGKLKATEIPFGARIIAVADAFDAMTSDRPHRRALSIDRAAEILRDGKGRQWDPHIVDAFLRSIGHGLRHEPLAVSHELSPNSSQLIAHSS
jgi:HD-GYP domain-containing protein (c-di-GMP phosphodiesterase class II)